MVEHKPLVNIPLVPSGQLPVKISGVKVTGLGLSWLQAIVAGQQIKFVPIVKDKDFVQCQVLLMSDTKNKKQQLLNIGENLVRIGFCQTEPIQHPLVEDPSFLTYYKRLQAAENYALRKKLGLKYYVKPTKNALGGLIKNLSSLSKNLTKFVKKQIKAVPHMTSA